MYSILYCKILYIYIIYRYSVTYVLLYSDISKNLKIPEQKYIN